MQRYWVRIGVGALVIFGVGMAGIRVGRKGVQELRAASLAPLQRLTRPLRAMAFRLDGRRIGRIQSVDVNHTGSWDANTVKLTVGLDQKEALGTLIDCNITAEETHHFDDRSSFHCAAAGDLGSLVELGQVRFEPGALTRPLYVSQDDVRRLERSDIRQLDASLNTDSGGKTVQGHANFDIEPRHGGRQRGTVNLDATDGRAFLQVRDDAGNELVKLAADEHGVQINIRDRHGRSLLKLLADKNK